MAFDTQRRPHPDEDVRKVTAAYTDASVAPMVVGELVKAGMDSADVTIMTPWPVSYPRQGEPLALDHPLKTALASALALGIVASATALLWANPGRWMAYGLLGAALGAVSSYLASALTATSPPFWHDRLLGDRLGAVTVEVSTTDATSADVARLVMTRHAPALMEGRTEPGPRPRSERVLWEHDDGLSPLEELGAWVRSTTISMGGGTQRRGRHLAVDRTGQMRVHGPR